MNPIRVLSILFLLITLKTVHAEIYVFPEQIEFDGQSFQKYSQATFKKGFFFKVFEASLYTENGSSTRYIFPSDTPLMLSIYYYRKLEAGLLNKSGEEILKDLYSAETLASFSQEFDQISHAMHSVQKGDVYQLFYTPERGIELVLNGKSLVTVSGNEFAKIYLSIWLGNHPSTQNLAEELLRQESGK
jgi:hypothetical protein